LGAYKVLAAIPCSFATELLEIRSKESSLHVLLIIRNLGPCVATLIVEARERIGNVQALLNVTNFYRHRCVL
jgi:hypothetical protein